MTKIKIVWLIFIIGLTVTTVQAEQLKSFELVNGDAESVKVVFRHNYPFFLEVALRQHKARELEEVTRTSIGQKIIITINGKAIAEPTVNETVLNGIVSIPANDEETAIQLAKSLTTPKKDGEPNIKEDSLKPTP